MKTSKTINSINRQIQTDLGRGLYDTLREEKFIGIPVSAISQLETDVDEWHPVGRVNIDPKTLGAFGPAIEKMSVAIRAAISKDGGFYIEYEYSYTHSMGGSNGYAVRTQYDAAGLKI